MYVSRYNSLIRGTIEHISAAALHLKEKKRKTFKTVNHIIKVTNILQWDATELSSRYVCKWQVENNFLKYYFFFISMYTILTDPSCLSIHDNCYTQDCVCNCLTAKKLIFTETQPKDTCTCRWVFKTILSN